MSLINDALKKAQRQRTEGSTPATEISTPSDPQEPIHRVARREKPVGFRSQLILVAGGAVAAVVLLGVGAFFFFRPTAETSVPAPARPTQVASAPAPAPAAAPVAPAPSAPVSTPTAVVSTATAPGPVSQQQSAPTAVVATPTNPAPVEPSAITPVAPPPAAAPVAFSIPNPAPAISPPVATSAPAATPSGTPERPKPSTRMIGVIEHLKVGGIRVAGAESKVLMNDRVYRINDVVDFELGIRLTGIEAKELTFEDSRGAMHVRTF